MAESPRDDPLVLTDPKAIRALAHPARLAVLDELGSGRRLTATECGEIAGLSTSAMSYHLRALERWGFVERAPATGDGRERPWRAVTTGGWTIDSGAASASGREAGEAVTAVMFDRVRAALRAWGEREEHEPKRWQDAALVGSTVRWVTPDEIEELIAAYKRLGRATKGRSAADHPDGARRVRLGVISVPDDSG